MHRLTAAMLVMMPRVIGLTPHDDAGDDATCQVRAHQSVQPIVAELKTDALKVRPPVHNTAACHTISPLSSPHEVDDYSHAMSQLSSLIPSSPLHTGPPLAHPDQAAQHPRGLHGRPLARQPLGRRPGRSEGRTARGPHRRTRYTPTYRAYDKHVLISLLYSSLTLPFPLPSLTPPPPHSPSPLAPDLWQARWLWRCS